MKTLKTLSMTAIFIMTFLGMFFSGSFYSKKNSRIYNPQTQTSVPKIVSASSDYNDLENRVEILFLFDTPTTDDVSNSNLFFQEEKDENADINVSLLEAQYELTKESNMVQMKVHTYEEKVLSFKTIYWLRIEKNGFEEKISVKTIEEGKSLNHKINVESNHDTIWFNGWLTQPTLGYYDELQWKIEKVDNTSHNWDGVFEITNISSEEITNFEKQIMVGRTNGVIPLTNYSVIIKIEKYGNSGFVEELFNGTVTTEKPPYVTNEAYGYTVQQIDHIVVDYSFFPPLDENYIATKLEIEIVDSNRGNIVTESIVANKSDITNGSKDFCTDLKSDSEYTIIGTMHYESIPFPPQYPGYIYKYDEKVFEYNVETSERPKPTIEKIKTDVFHNKIDATFKLKQPLGQDGTYDAFQLNVKLFDENNSRTPLGKISLEKDKFDNEIEFNIQFKNLVSEKSYSINFEYLIEQEKTSPEWTPFYDFKFSTIREPKPSGEIEITIPEEEKSPTQLKWGYRYENPTAQEAYNINELKWSIKEKNIQKFSGVIDHPQSSEEYEYLTAENLLPTKEYMLILEYQTTMSVEEDASEWHELSSREFQIDAPPKPLYNVVQSWAGYNTFETVIEFTQSGIEEFKIEELEWRILDKNKNEIFTSTTTVSEVESTILTITPPNNQSLTINNEYSLEIKEIYTNVNFAYMQEYKTIHSINTYDVFMPSEGDIKEERGNDKLSLSFDMFNVPDNWENNQKQTNIGNKDLDKANFDKVVFKLYEFDESGNKIKEAKETKTLISTDFDYNRKITLSTTFDNLEHSTKYAYEISVWRDNNLHEFAFNKKEVSGSLITKYKFWYGYILYPSLVLLMFIAIVFILNDLLKDRKIKSKIIEQISDSISELLETITPFIAPTGYFEYEELKKESKKELHEKLNEKNIEWEKGQTKAELSRILTGFTSDEINFFKEQVEFEYKKEQEEYENLLKEYSESLLEKGSVIMKFVRDKFPSKKANNSNNEIDKSEYLKEKTEKEDSNDQPTNNEAVIHDE